MQSGVRTTLKAVIDSLRFHVALLDAQGYIVLTNEQWCNFAADNGGTAEMGSNYLSVCTPEMRAAIEQVMEGTLPRWVHEYPCHSPTERRFFKMEVSRLEVPGGPFVMVSHENITAYQLSLFEVNSLNAALRTQTEMLAQYTFATAHALQEPLRRLTTTSSALESLTEGSNRLRQYAHINLRAARQMSSLVSSLGNYAELIPQHTDPLRKVDFGRCLSEAALALGMRLWLPAPLPLTLMGREHARTLAHNLLDNFRLLCMEGELLEVQSASDGEFIHVYLRLQSIEERQVDAALQLFQPQGRAALGLSQQVAAKYGGQMWIEQGGANIGLHLTLPAWKNHMALSS